MSQNGTGEFSVELPSGGFLKLQNDEEVDLWEVSAKRYLEDYPFTKQNDRVLLSAILTSQLVLFRSQQAVADADTKNRAEEQNRMLKAAGEIRDLEKSLGIDKKSREAGGQHTVATYVENLKRAAHEKGVRIAARVKMIEALMMDMSWKIRLLRNGDEEDRRHHGISEAGIVNELERRIDEIHEADKKWIREKGSVFVGRL